MIHFKLDESPAFRRAEQYTKRPASALAQAKLIPIPKFGPEDTSWIERLRFDKSWLKVGDKAREALAGRPKPYGFSLINGGSALVAISSLILLEGKLACGSSFITRSRIEYMTNFA